METTQALDILKSLADGVNPYSGAPLPAESVYQHPDTVRALFHAIGLLGNVDAPSPKAQPSPRPSTRHGNAGKPWTEAEDRRLLEAFERGEPIETIATSHARSRVAVEARLAKFGRIPMPAGMRTRPAVAQDARPAAAYLLA